MRRIRASAIILTGGVALSLLFSLARSGPIYGSTAALILSVLGQVYLPGYLLARALGKHRHPHPLMRFAWILAGGLSLTVVMGSAARLLNLPVMTYLLALHAVMLVLAWLPAQESGDELPWRFSWRKLPYYLVVLAACGVLMEVNNASRNRFYGFEDQVIFISHIGWLANNPGETPDGGPLRSRQVGVHSRDSRFDSDGWTYDEAAWVWVSGVPAAELVWFNLDPLFLWAVPLIVFAMAYEITRREEAAAWAVAAMMLVGLMTLDNIAHYPSYTAYGRLAVFQLTTLRQASLTLILPLTLMVGFTALRTRRKRELGMMILSGIALAIFHPFQITLFVISIAATAGVYWLVHPGRRAALIRLLPLGAALIFLLALPFIQRLNRSGLNPADTLIRDVVVEEAETTTADSGFLILPDFPLTGSTYVRSPAQVFYHPAIALAVVLGLLHIVALRRSLAAAYIFGVTAVFLLFNFTPGLTPLVNKFISSVGLLTTIFLLPVALVLGHSLDCALRWFSERTHVYPAWLVSLIAVGAACLLLFEPLPIPVSARDQIQSFNEMQEIRRLRPAQIALSEHLQNLLPPDQTRIVMAPADTVSLVIEDLPRTLVTGGRRVSNWAHFGDDRFYNYETAEEWSPWLDGEDLDFMAEYGVTDIVVRADATRAAQLLLAPDRFPLLDRVDGQVIFARSEAIVSDADDDLFAQMNALYPDTPQPRWGPLGFEMPRPGSPELWGSMAAAWQARLAQQPGDDRARLGLAFSDLMMGADEQALPVWQQLHDSYPDIPLFNEALARTYVALDQPQQGAEVLIAALDSSLPETQVLAARALLSESFFYLLDSDQLDQVLAVTRNDADTWDYLNTFDEPDRLRQQAALLMTAQRWTAATDWLGQLSDIMTSPRDITAQAVMMLAQGDIDGALARLKPATDPDWRAARAYWQPDRWAENHAERLYHLLTGDLAMRDGRYNDAAAAYQQAVDSGASEVGDYFLTQALEASGQTAQATALQAEIDPTVELVPMLTVANTDNPFVMQPEVEQDEANHSLTITATFGNPQPHGGYPVKTWRVEVISPDAATRYAALDAPARLVEDALVRAAVTVPLPDDLDPLTPALVIITPVHNNAITYTPAIVPVTLNRPDSAAMPSDAQPLDLSFGDSITLESYAFATHEDGIDLTLYWRTDAPLPENYQVFVHVLDSSGEIIAQDDGAPVQNRYPTRQWRTDVTIADDHHLALDHLPEHFALRLGLYRLPEGTRLPITPVDDRVQSDSVIIYQQ